ncbi:hypothetical protein N0V90_007565 [Kalmusia sp. IMI 367209]|nr:hypothetical protein N0V90_007565 [Kalmusia sp. IMI 367209]
MQYASGNRGATVYDVDELDEDIQFAREIDEWADDNVNASVPEIRESGIYTVYASVNLRDQYDVAAAATDSSLCVEGSTGFATKTTSTPFPTPVSETKRPNLIQENTIIEKVGFNIDIDDSFRDKKETEIRSKNDYRPCNTSGAKEGDPCSAGQDTGSCKLIKDPCRTGGEKLYYLPSCGLPGLKCPKSGICAGGSAGQEIKDRGITLNYLKIGGSVAFSDKS